MEETRMSGEWRHILTTTDFSPLSENAFPEALRLAQLIGENKAKITLLNILSDVSASVMPYAFGSAVIDASGIMERAQKEAEQKIESYKENFFKGFQVDTTICRSTQPPHREVLNYIGKNEVDILVLSTQGRSGVSRILMGSVAEKIIRESPCPVLLVPNDNE